MLSKYYEVKYAKVKGIGLERVGSLEEPLSFVGRNIDKFKKK
jgi:hypothetical protein